MCCESFNISFLPPLLPPVSAQVPPNQVIKCQCQWRMTVKNGTSVRQHCRRNIFSYFGWLWEILSELIWDEQACLTSVSSFTCFTVGAYTTHVHWHHTFVVWKDEKKSTIYTAMWKQYICGTSFKRPLPLNMMRPSFVDGNIDLREYMQEYYMLMYMYRNIYIYTENIWRAYWEGF